MSTQDLHGSTTTGEPTFGNEELPDSTKEIIEAQKAKIAQMMPTVDYVLDYIKEEQTVIRDIHAYITSLGNKPDNNAIMDEYRARVLYDNMLTRLSNDLRNKVMQTQEQANG